MGEFELIRATFRAPCAPRHAWRWASATTAPCCSPRPAMQLAVSTDMLVEGRHFLPTWTRASWATRRWRST
jgi:thiamine-monophosphate kinase